MLGAMMVMFAVLVVAGAVLYFIDQQLAGWIVAVFASGLAGALVGELFNRQRHEAAHPGGDADPGPGGTDPDGPGSSEGLSGPGGSGSGTDGDVERSSGGGTLYSRRKADRRFYLQLVFGWRRK